MSNPFYNPSGTPATASSGSSSLVRTEFTAIAAGFALLPSALTANKAVVMNAGGTGMTLTTGSLALAGNLTTVGAFAVTLTAAGTTALNLPTTGTLLSDALTSGSILVGSASNLATAVAMSGDISLVASGATTVASIRGAAVSGTTGSGSVAFATSPTLVTPVLGVATATSINKMAITAPATGSTLAVADGKTATHNATTTFAGTDGKTLTISNSGTLSGGDAFVLSIAAAKTLTVSNTLTLAGTDSTTMTFPATSANVAALNLTNQALSGGARVTSFSIGTVSSGTTTLDPGNGPLQYLTNNGAFTLAAPSAGDGSLVLYVLNAGSAGAITFSGFTVSSSVGDALTTTNTSKFKIYVDRVNSISSYVVKALQ